MPPIFGALEAGGTKMVCAAATAQGQILDRLTIPTRTPQETIPELLAFFRDKGLSALGVGSFGPLELDPRSPDYGVIQAAPKASWRGCPILALLRDGGATERHARALLRLPDLERQLEAARQLTADRLTVAQTEALVDSILLAAAPPPRRQPTFIIKDVRLFLNTITRSLDIMRSAGVDAQCKRQDSEEEILLTIHIPRRTG